MKYIVSFIFFSSLTLNSWGLPPVIYGLDNRIELFETSWYYQNLGRSTATLVPQEKMIVLFDGQIQIDQTTFKTWLESQISEKSFISLNHVNSESLTFCSNEKFIDQPVAGACSGFLIAPDLIVTAGHCAKLDNFCENFKWIFDYQNNEEGMGGQVIPPSDIYSCRRVVSHSLDMELERDYALVQLDRIVSDRVPLDIRLEGKIEDNASLFVIGNPSGLPLKFADGATVRENENIEFFVTNLDTFQGNSGSAVFNENTGIVEGILVRGEEDFEFNQFDKCIESKKCKVNECRGEDVSRMSSIPEIRNYNSLHLAAKEGNLTALAELLKLNLWIDIYGKDRRSPLIKASIAGKKDTMLMLLNGGADINLADIEGNTIFHYFALYNTESHLEALKEVLEVGGDINLKNISGETPLLIAARLNNLDALKYLIDAGAEIHHVDKNGQSALFHAFWNNSSEAIEILLKGEKSEVVGAF